jgi:hypothetical protein
MSQYYYIQCESVYILIFVLLLVLTIKLFINPLNAGLNPICQLLALLGAYPMLHVSRIRVNFLHCDKSGQQLLSVSLRQEGHINVRLCILLVL